METDEKGGLTVLAELRYEWLRVTTIRSTWICLVLAFLGAGAIALAAPASNAGNVEGSPLDPPTIAWWEAFSQPLLLPVVLASVVAAQNIGQEYRFGLMRVTLTAFPRRGRMVAAKAVAVLVAAVTFTAVSYAASWLAMTARGFPLPPDDAVGDVTLVLRGATFAVLWALSAWSLAGITRQTAIGVALPVVSGFIAEPIVAGMLADQASWLGRMLPWSTGARWATSSVAGQTASATTIGGAALAVFGVWVAVLVAWEIVLFLRRDA